MRSELGPGALCSLACLQRFMHKSVGMHTISVVPMLKLYEHEAYSAPACITIIFVTDHCLLQADLFCTSLLGCIPGCLLAASRRNGPSPVSNTFASLQLPTHPPEHWHEICNKLQPRSS